MMSAIKYSVFVLCACTAIIIGLFCFTYNDTTIYTSLKMSSSRHGLLSNNSFGWQTKPKEIETRHAKRIEMGHATKGGAVCNVTAFKHHLRLNETPPVVPVHLLAGCRHLVYNRIPKTGSRTIKTVQFEMARMHRFVQIEPLFEHDLNMLNINSLHKMKILKNKFEALDYRFIMSRHGFYVNFMPYFGHNPVYINVFREPTPWMVSWFNFQKYGPLGKPKGDIFSSTDLQSCFRNDTCWNVLGRHSISGNAIHYTCGTDAACGNQSANALQMAKKHLRENYLVVGLSERLSEYFEVLEFLMPHMFKGSVGVYRKYDHYERTRTQARKKDPIDKETYQLLKSKLSLDYELYHYAVDKFDKMLAAVRYIKSNSRMIIARKTNTRTNTRRTVTKNSKN